MGKFKEIDRQRQEVEEVMNEQEVITIPIYYSIDDETGIRHYDTDSIRNEFEVQEVGLILFEKEKVNE